MNTRPRHERGREVDHQAPPLVEDLRTSPGAPLKPCNDGPEVMAHAESALEASHRQWEEPPPPTAGNGDQR